MNGRPLEPVMSCPLLPFRPLNQANNVLEDDIQLGLLRSRLRCLSDKDEEEVVSLSAYGELNETLDSGCDFLCPRQEVHARKTSCRFFQ